MADGMDRGLALRLGIPPHNERCLRCERFSGEHTCGFFYGRFDPANWRCATLIAMQQIAYLQETVSTRHGVTCAVLAHPNVLDGYALLAWQIGQPQRVSSALWFDTLGRASALTVTNAERLLQPILDDAEDA